MNQNLSSFHGWNPIDGHRQMKVVSDGKILVIRPLDATVITVPLFCDICKFPMKTAEDSIAFRKSQMCGKCHLYCHGHKEYIDKTSDQWKEYLQNRKLNSKPHIVFK